MASFLLMRADEVATWDAAVTTTAGATDTTYTDDWLCDMRVGRPAKATNGTVMWSATFTSAEVGMIVAANCNSDVNATLGGGVSGTITAGALQADGIRLNGFATQTPAAETNITIAFSGAASAVVLGELIAGKYRTLSLPVWSSDERSDVDYTRPQDLDLASIPPYDSALASRVWSGTFHLTTADKDILRGAFLAQKNGTRPTVVILDSTVNDAMVGFLSAPSCRPISGTRWAVDVTFTEIPRVRW